MDTKTLTALNGSIAKWEWIVAGTGVDEGAFNCPLCTAFIGDSQECKACPVMKNTGQVACYGSPYPAFSAHMSRCDRQLQPINSIESESDREEARRLAQAELDFLKGLLPKDGAECN